MESETDKYGGRYIESAGVKELPPNPTLLDRIADVLRTDDEWQWREAINIHGYDVFELLRESAGHLATAPRWHDRPTVPGLWLCRTEDGPMEESLIMYLTQEDIDRGVPYRSPGVFGPILEPPQ